MRSSTVFGALVAAAVQAAAAVTGAAEGFAKGVTGGGSSSAVYPTTTAQLVSYLGDSSARVIYLDRTFDFTGSEGTASETGCAPWGTGSACQLAINKDNWCNNYQASAPKVNVRYDKAGLLGITVRSNKSIIGVGNKGVIRGKGLRIVSGANNIIIQNIHITNLNPQYVWGGDAITLDGADMVWIDRVTTSLIGRQHVVLGNSASNRVTISNSKFDGTTSWSATCDGHHYWGLYFTGSNDLITFKNNYVYRTSGRSPKVAGNTLLHAVNNYFYDNSGHAFEIDAGGMVLAEGNVFQNVKESVSSTRGGQLFGSPNASANSACSSALGRACQVNGFGSSGALPGTDTGFLGNFRGKNIASASTYDVAKNVQNTAGFGKI
ncbi:polysaccharide lyase family 1 protein [Stachybotrys elegans]|uniref:pectin lyase n=1 Tax=Stachybotrys elegans TaxID=80388 RepID=A0A8K0T368_9HYPO|nr:polysaccharide lyase family 1 protein [Stachybotrys elegans]